VEIATFVTVRTGSSRLPGKALIEIRGRTLFERMVERVRRAEVPQGLIVCTTTLPADDRIEAEAARLGVECHRGEESDILARWLGAVRKWRLTRFVACDGDNMFCDPGYVDRVAQLQAETGAGFVSCEGLPLGVGSLCITAQALECVCALKTETDTEGQGRFFADETVVERAVVHADEAVRLPEARLTTDYPEDLQMLEAIVAELERPGQSIALPEIVALLRGRPDIFSINQGRQAEYWERFNARYPPVDLQ
jgi:spore coat polysaccharide biosynthesis protein SpsF